MELKELKRKIPYQWRVQSYSKFKPEAMCVAYIDARDVMELLDEVCGPENWQSDFKDIGGQMFAGIGIRQFRMINNPQGNSMALYDEDREWVWKWDTGTETKVEAEKGQASDSFKRAAVKWGIGRFLYDLEVKRVRTDGALSDTHKYPNVVDDGGNKVWDLTKHINGAGEKAPVASQKPVGRAEAPKGRQVTGKDPEAALRAAKDRIVALVNKANDGEPIPTEAAEKKAFYAEQVFQITGQSLPLAHSLEDYEAIGQALAEELEKKK